jgi:hypothetical protein
MFASEDNLGTCVPRHHLSIPVEELERYCRELEYGKYTDLAAISGTVNYG